MFALRRYGSRMSRGAASKDRIERRIMIAEAIVWAAIKVFFLIVMRRGPSWLALFGAARGLAGIGDVGEEAGYTD